jgi:hypothetical protein
VGQAARPCRCQPSPGAARRVPDRAARLLHPPRRRPVRPHRRAAVCPGRPSVAHLSLEPAHRRGWGSAYDALASGWIDAERLRALLVATLPDADPLVFAVDVTTWPRCDAECSPERGYYYHPSRHSAGQPIIAGWADQWICQLSFDRDSWTAPVAAQRLHPLDDTDQTAAGQIRALVGRLDAGARMPLFVFDAGYDSAQLTLDSPRFPPRCWCGSGRTAASTPTRHQRRAHQGAAGHAATAPSSTAPTRPPGPPRPPPLAATTISTAPSRSRAGRGCIPSSSAIPATAAEGRGRSCAARSSAWLSSGSPPRRGRRRCCGCDGPVLASSIWTLSGGRMSAGSTWNTPSGSPSRPWPGPPPGRATLSRPTAGPGWCWPATPSCAWPASSPAISGCRGSGLDRGHGCHRIGCAVGFRGFCSGSTRQLLRRNPQDARQAGPKVAARVPRPATRRSRSPPRSPGRSQPRPPRPPDQTSPPPAR